MKVSLLKIARKKGLADPKLLGSKGKKWQQAKVIIDRWTVLFSKKDI